MRDIIRSPAKKSVTTCCSICHEDINDTTGSTKLSCSHLYHLGCIVKWLSINPSCPCCRKNLSEYENVKETHNSSEPTEITEDDLIINQMRAEAFEELIELAITQIQLPPHVLRMPLSLQAFE